MAIDYATNLGRVRLVISDVDEDNLTLSDAQLEAFLDMNGDNVRRAAADALDTIATSEALVSKVIRDHELSTDGAKLSAELRARATNLRMLADEEDTAADGFFIVPPNIDDGGRPELTEWPYRGRAWGL